jgi:hypothetical protein
MGDSVNSPYKRKIGFSILWETDWLLHGIATLLVPLPAVLAQNRTRSCASTSKSNGFGPVTGVTTPTASRVRW